ncbi:MAG: DegT/DnrJ/EryC1/StrS family aminotransferase [Clostridiales bacterium]|nr:DegT/DnrJ/EryC1/StrS family aminotransferase [Clostridiales bacterium]MBS5877615.1 DegT/DnrJ/EryC1/StrS family aminotransferase [Clostridiales bacterium]MDU0939498.1 DegT/DnrJ/EryC1/StrS family aminotransferase [Clostridiales bacterium]MDU1042030.1 DegT/DnrJ/EryC1/StrS family aminotransferase [Clostridiales bacterium]
MKDGEIRNIPFSPPDIGEGEVEEVIEALRSGWITTGPRTKELERQVADFCGTEKAACLNSSTAAMELSLRLFEIGLGDEVIVPAYTYTATASAVCHTGAKPVMIDVEEGTFHMDYDALERTITPATKAVIPVDYAGISEDYDLILDIVKRKSGIFKAHGRYQQALGRILVLADSAHGYGAEYKGRRSGQSADLTTFSFHAVKNFTTAEGGAVTWKHLDGIDDEDIYKDFMLLSLHGQSKDALAKTRPGAWEYDIVAPLYKCNMTDIHAAIGLGQMKRYPALLKRREELIGKYTEKLTRRTRDSEKDDIEILSHKSEKYRSSGHLFVVRFTGKDEVYRNKFIEKMADKGIACNVHYKPLPMLTAYKDLGYDINDYPNAYDQYKCEMTLPLHTKLSDEDIAYICHTFNDIASILE